MAAENVAKFAEMLKTDETLMAKLSDAVAAYMDKHPGDTENEQAVFDAVVAPMAAEAGLPITYDEAKSVLADDEDHQLDLDELDAAAGGSGGCLSIGFSTKPQAECGKGGFACAYIGIGVVGSSK